MVVVLVVVLLVKFENNKMTDRFTVYHPDWLRDRLNTQLTLYLTEGVTTKNYYSVRFNLAE